MGYKETAVSVYCPLLYKELDVYVRSSQWEDIFIADFNGCDHYSGASACEECRKKTQAQFTASHPCTPPIQWRKP